MSTTVRTEQYLNLIKSEIDKIESMPNAPLDGASDNQKINTEKLIAKIRFYDSVKEILKEECKDALEPCPWCGGETYLYQWSDGRYDVRCCSPGCHYVSLSFDSLYGKDEAIARHNRAVRSIRFTK